MFTELVSLNALTGIYGFLLPPGFSHSRCTQSGLNALTGIYGFLQREKTEELDLSDIVLMP